MMTTKQEKIEEGTLAILIDEAENYWLYNLSILSREAGSEKAYLRKVTELILAYLDSESARLMVKCPDCEWSQFGEEVAGMTPCYSCNSTGYIIERLIEVGK